MKQSSFILIIMLVAVAAISQPVNKQEREVQQTIQNLFTALSNRDSAGLRLHSTADVHFYEYGEVWTIDSLIKKVMYVKPADYKRTNNFGFVKTTIEENTAWATYYLQSEITRNGKKEIVKWMETVVLVKEKLNWKIAVLHSTRLAVK